MKVMDINQDVFRWSSRSDVVATQTTSERRLRLPLSVNEKALEGGKERDQLIIRRFKKRLAD